MGLVRGRWPSLARRLEPLDVVVERFDDTTVAGLPDGVARYLRQAIAPGTPLAPAVRLRIRGQIRLGGRWRPFRSREVLDPTRGLVWWGRVAGIVCGGDCAFADLGHLEWRVLGLVPVARAEGADVARSGLARALAEACLWAPTTVLPDRGIRWADDPADARAITASLDTPYETVVHRMALDDAGRVVASVLDRWGDPEGTGSFALAPFGGCVDEWRTSGGVTIAARGRVGWWYGTERWDEGEFFRYEVDDCELLTGRR